ncbi:SDR family NAD(P)-dependent oxidoreductase [Acidovorax sp. Be4]|uniref:SDR family NAD(P)-dependent oxidoreductase n=1 Tax=Acidovorax bellezanensis TaxID=2976702 RepID=A0ABT2PP21_9BURK|nr:SDR family NAD(P)-dependent oxidoreductase [Acidovorax sp. Be4]MCT9812229.1 SDR family NAD(P)-dependent oxidoreductase [Acidovorax sp. Be4]
MPLFGRPLNPPLQDWSGRWVWVIGASSGIGRATAAALHSQGARVIVSARNASALDDFVKDHAGCLALPLDVSDANAVRDAALQVQDHAGHQLALALYCAGHYRAQSATVFDLAEMQRHLAVNYCGALYLLDALLPMLLLAGSGHISLVGSVAGYRGLPLSLAYGPTKAALNNLAENLYLDLHSRGLGVSVINPGFVDTPLTADNLFAMPALISAEQAAQCMLEGWRQGRFEMNFPRRFTRWMRLLRCLPDAWYFAAVRRATGAR